MKERSVRGRWSAFTLISLLLLSGHAPAADPAAVQAPPPGAKVIESPTMKVGDTRTYRRADGIEHAVKVVEVSESGYVSENTLRPGVRAHVDRHGVVTKLDGDPQALATVNPRLILGWKWADFPMWPGKQFSYRVEGSIAWFP